MKNNLSFLINYLKKESINIDFNEFIFQAETHPDFPSLYSFSDTLRFFNIENLAARVSKESLDELPDRFIALLKPENLAPFLSFVEKQNNGYKYTDNNQEHFIDREGFLTLWQEVVLVVERTEDIISSDTKSDQVWLPVLALGIVAVLGILWYAGPGFVPAVLLLLGLSGVFLTSEVLKKVFGVTSTFAAAVCGAGAAMKSGCDAVINSKKMKLFPGLEFTDLSVIFFSGYLISFYLMSVSGNFQHFLNYSLITLVLGVPFIVYSLYYQWRIEKSWCTICLLIIGVFSAQLVTVLFYGSFSAVVPEIAPLSLFLTGFITSASAWLLAKPRISAFFDLKSSESISRRFKRNYALFRLALKDSRHFDYSSLESPIYLGNPDANLKISLVTNLFCGYCVGMHEQLENILKRYGNDMRVNIRFNLDLKDTTGTSDLLYFRLLEIYFQDGQEAFLKALGGWFRNKDTDAWFSTFGTGTPDTKAANIFKLQYEQNTANELLFTPALIVGEHLYPNVYDRADLIHFISELIDDENLFSNLGLANHQMSLA